MFFDTHAHYDSHKFDSDRMDILASMPDNHVSLIVNPGCDIVTSRTAVSLAEQFPFVYAAIGWHPSDLIDGGWNDGSIEELRQLAKHPKVVAIGEIGLDYYWDKTYIDLQHKALRAQMDLALELGLPVIIHDREAHGDCFDMVCKYPKVRGVFHSYSGSAEMAADLIRRGWMISFSGVVTFKNAERVRAVAASVPMDKMFIETDCPYLAPHPHRGECNHSGFLEFTAQTIGQLHGITGEEVAKITAKNAAEFFGIQL